MRHAKPPPARNKIDLADPGQTRILKKRLGVSADDLQSAVAKVGNSIASVSKEIETIATAKEVEPQKAIPATEPAPGLIESPSPLEGDAVAASAA